MYRELDEIEYNAEGIRLYADRIAVHASYLSRRAPFDTKMEATLDKAEETLSRALVIIREAKAKYETLEEAA